MQNAQEKVWFARGAQPEASLAPGLHLKASPIAPLPPPLSPILSFLALWPQCCSWTRLVLCVVISQDLALVFSHQEHPSPRYVHGSLLTSCRCSQPRHLCPPSQTCDPLLHFFFFLELITMQLPVCFTYLYFYLPCYFPLMKV